MKNPLRFLILCSLLAAATLVAWTFLPGGPHAGAAALSPAADIPDRAAGPERWKRDLHHADEQLRSGRWSDALETSSAVLRSMQNHLQGGEGAGRFLAAAELYRAVAEEGLERHEDASWDWLTAWNLDAEVAHADLAAFGAAGASLHARTAPWGAHQAAAAHKRTEPFLASMDGVTKPERIGGASPTYPEAERHACRSGKVIIESLLDRTGRISAFHVAESMNPQFDLAALEAIHQWRFRPALLAGNPVAVYYTLTVNFQIPHCTPRG